jgi:hypothetical protein
MSSEYKWNYSLSTWANESARHALQANPVVKETPLRAYPGWAVREYRNGTFDCANAAAISPGYDTFAEAVEFAKRDGASA